MSHIHLRHIKTTLSERFAPLIDTSDMASFSGDNRERMITSRALSAFAVSIVADVSPEVAAASITDGFNDGGIDAVLYDPGASRLYFVQGKWSEAGTGSPELGDIEKFLTGVDRLLRQTYAEFNPRILGKQAEIERALANADTTIHLVVVHSGTQGLSPNVAKRIEEFTAKLNDASEVATHECIEQSGLHAALTRAVEGGPISLEVLVHDWGFVREPYTAYYGRIAASDVAGWWDEHKDRLFAKNIRKFIGDTAINVQMAEGLKHHPDRFWYFNNGITLLCKDVKKKLMGGADRATAVLACEGASVVNGAQTVGTIGRVWRASPEALAQAHVMVRVISLEGGPEGFATAVTKATNTQNRVQSRDFASLDPEQERIAREMLLDGRRYHFKMGEDDVISDTACTIEEATVALACAHVDLRLTVIAKGQVGTLWDDLTTKPYKSLFNSGTTAEDIWWKVKVLRDVEATVQSEQAQTADEPLRKQVAIHGNRFVARQVFRVLRTASGVAPLEADIPALTRSLLDLVTESVRTVLDEPYLAWTFKNATKCEQLEAWLTSGSVSASVSKRQRKVTIEPSGQESFDFEKRLDPREAHRGVVDPAWTLEEAVSAATRWYGSTNSGAARNAAVEAWAAVVGPRRAGAEVDRIVAFYGSETAASKALAMSVPTLRRFRDSFARVLPRFDEQGRGEV